MSKTQQFAGSTFSEHKQQLNSNRTAKAANNKQYNKQLRKP